MYSMDPVHPEILRILQKEQEALTMATIRFSATEIAQFFAVRAYDPDSDHLRVGQHFFNYFNCHKVTSPGNREMLDKLYEMDGEEATAFIRNNLTCWSN